VAVFPGTYVPTGLASSAKFNHLIDDLMTPRLMSFRQICIHDEPASLSPNDNLTWGVTWGNWCTAAPIRVRKNEVLIADASVTNVNYTAGTFRAGPVTVDASGRPRTTIEVGYWFDYFPVAILEGFYTAAVSIINMTAFGPPTSYTVDTAPTNWEGVMTDLAFAMCMEKLLLDYDLWRYRLLFAIGPNEIEGGGGDIAGQLETLKSNAEQRAEKAMDNEKFKTGNYLSPPTQFYFQGISGIGGSRGLHGIPFSTGKLHGWKPNRYV
jgi:hypothetical protein